MVAETPLSPPRSPPFGQLSGRRGPGVVAGDGAEASLRRLGGAADERYLRLVSGFLHPLADLIRQQAWDAETARWRRKMRRTRIVLSIVYLTVSTACYWAIIAAAGV